MWYQIVSIIAAKWDVCSWSERSRYPHVLRTLCTGQNWSAWLTQTVSAPAAQTIMRQSETKIHKRIILATSFQPFRTKNTQCSWWWLGVYFFPGVSVSRGRADNRSPARSTLWPRPGGPISLTPPNHSLLESWTHLVGDSRISINPGAVESFYQLRRSCKIGAKSD